MFSVLSKNKILNTHLILITVVQSNLDYPDLDYPDFFSGPNFVMNIY